MPLLEDIKNWLRQHPLIVVGTLVLSVLAFGAILEEFDRITLFLGNIVMAGVKVDWAHHTVVPKSWFVVTILLLLMALILSLALLARSFVLTSDATQKEFERLGAQLEQQRSRFVEVEEGAAIGAKTLHRTIEAASRIRDQLFPAGERQLKRFEFVECTYSISKNLDGGVERSYGIKASGKPINFFEIWQRVEDQADGVEFLDQIQFKAHGGDGSSLPYLQARNELREKSVIIWFLPRIDPTEVSPRIATLSDKCPGMFTHLGQLGREEYVWSFESPESIPRAAFTFYLESGTGRDLRCSVSGSRDGKQSLERTRDAKNGWDGWVYKLEGVPSGTYKLMLELHTP
jgi:hypothetical protein